MTEPKISALRNCASGRTKPHNGRIRTLGKGGKSGFRIDIFTVHEHLPDVSCKCRSLWAITAMELPPFSKSIIHFIRTIESAQTVIQKWWKAPTIALLVLVTTASGEESDLEEKLRELETHNAELLQLALKQQEQIEALRSELNAIKANQQEQSIKIEDLEAEVEENPSPSRTPRATLSGNILISGSAGVAFFSGESNNAYNSGEFVIDEARLLIEAEVSKGVYLVSELELFKRESSEEALELGELYIEIDNISRFLGQDDLATLRAGRVDIPFGYEYQNRDVMQNPLITHSLSDLWGIDEGIEVFGSAGKFSYVAAVLNGGHSFLRDHNWDKALVGRLEYAPTRRFRLSASGMRTGALSVARDDLSEIWIGNGFFRSIGSNETTEFEADLFQLDARFDWTSGYLAVAAGGAWYRDNDPLADNSRTLKWYQLEAKQSFADNFFGAARISWIESGKGYPIAGLGSRGRYFFADILTEELWRLGIGLGYRPMDDLVLKLEYTWEEGHLTNGAERRDFDLLSAELGVQF